MSAKILRECDLLLAIDGVDCVVYRYDRMRREIVTAMFSTGDELLLPDALEGGHVVLGAGDYIRPAGTSKTLFIKHYAGQWLEVWL